MSPEIGGEHVPVMLDEVIEGLNIKADGCYVDGTFGRGGHTAAILQRLSPRGSIVAFDRDPSALRARADLAADPRVRLVHTRFSAGAEVLRSLGLAGRVDGVLLDLGVSSPQLDDAERGFSFRFDGPIDMRMDPSCGQSAADWLNRAREEDIAGCLREYGEERMARRVARSICRARAVAPITRTRQLAEIVARAVPHERRIDPATRTFQALRIKVNDELDELREGLVQLLAPLAAGGRLAAISFHSLEDRIVKRFFRDVAAASATANGDAPRYALALRRSRVASDTEIATNPRARSARLRILERVA